MILYTKYSRRGAEEYMSKLTSAISNLKKRLDKDEALLVQQENGYLEKVYVKLNAPATKKKSSIFHLSYRKIMKNFYDCITVDASFSLKTVEIMG